MKHLPRRISLVAQTARILREEIAGGTWREFLPGERELCARFRVSRPTMRAALELLRREGCLEVSHGKQRRICTPSKLRRRSATPNRVGLLTPVPLHQMPPFALCWVDELRERLAEEGFDLVTHVVHTPAPTQSEKMLERLDHDVRASVWVLFLSNEAMQRWFAGRGLAAIVTGSCFPGIQLPSIDIDYRAACRHAVGLLATKGHRQIALFLPKTRMAGDDASETGFVEGTQSSVHNIRASVIRHDETVRDICQKLDHSLRVPNRTTAFLVARSMHALTTLTHLQGRGLRLPQDVALISRDNDIFLDFTTPRLTSYASNPSEFARRLSRLVLQMATSQAIPAKPILLMPKLIRGQTI